MGAFFTNIQLRTSTFNEAEILESVIEYITKFNTETGFIKVDNDERSDKTVIISFPKNSKWLSIYDEEMEDKGPSKLNELSSKLSKHFKTTALSILVNDSDSMYVGLNSNGALRDSISNLTKEIDFKKSKPNLWTDILLEDYSFENIKNAWLNKSALVEVFLAEFSKLIDLDPSKLLTGYEYLNEEKPNEGIKLNFVQKDKKKTAELGLTKLSMLSGAGLVDVKIGEKCETEWMMTNFGTFSNGIDILVTGECIENGLLIPEIAKATYLKYKNERQNEFTSNFIEAISTNGKKIFYARFEDIYIPKGFQPIYPMTPKEGKRYEKICCESAIKFNISFIGGRIGNGELTTYFSPIDNRQEGSYTADFMKGKVTE